MLLLVKNNNLLFSTHNYQELYDASKRPYRLDDDNTTGSSDDTSTGSSDYICNITKSKTINHGIAVGPCFTPRNYINWTDEILKRHSSSSDSNITDESLLLLYQKKSQ